MYSPIIKNLPLWGGGQPSNHNALVQPSPYVLKRSSEVIGNLKQARFNPALHYISCSVAFDGPRL